jgi:hypothetical protein
MKSTKLVLLIALAISFEKFIVSFRTSLFMWIITMSWLLLVIIVIEALDKRRKRKKLEAIKLLQQGKPSQQIMLLILLQLVGEDIGWQVNIHGNIEE